jgi:hypothetical protein
MSDIYIIGADGSTSAMNQVQCKDEEKELQEILEKNFDLLPGSQIRPDDHCRWLLIKREMPVPDPNTGGDRWSIDFLFVDQTAMPTFVECKRFQDTRSRREVIGQMMEYAANAQYYWDKEKIREYATASVSAQPNFEDLEEAIRSLQPESGDSIDDFLEAIENNLREGQVRLIFFMEQAPVELKSIVDFLNSQMERSEVLIVEAKQYQKEDTKVIVPRLFGYTEEARRIKRSVTVTGGDRIKWNEEKFFRQARERLSDKELEAVTRLLTFSKSSDLEITWGTGKDTGSYSIIPSTIFAKSIISVFTNGKIAINFGAFRGHESTNEFREDLANALIQEMNISIPDDYIKRYPYISPSDWVHKVDNLVDILKRLIEKYERVH